MLRLLYVSKNFNESTNNESTIIQTDWHLNDCFFEYLNIISIREIFILKFNRKQGAHLIVCLDINLHKIQLTDEKTKYKIIRQQ